MYWKIEESVGKYYFTLPGMFLTKEAAETEMLARHGKQSVNMRAALYTSSGWQGAHRVGD